MIFSEREAQKEWRAKPQSQAAGRAQYVGDVVNGVVTGLRDFGAFVNIGGADGLIHVSELAWHRVDHPRDILHIGEEIEVYVLNLDRQTNRIALSRKRLLSDPWDDAQFRYHEGQLVVRLRDQRRRFWRLSSLWKMAWKACCISAKWVTAPLKEPYSYVQKGDQSIIAH